MLKPKHPKHGGTSFEDFANSFPSDYMNFPTMGAWVVVEHRPDDIVIKRRNPYYWKVDEAGQQLPYLDEMSYSPSLGQISGLFKLLPAPADRFQCC